MTYWCLVDRFGWSYDINARAVARELSDLDIRIVANADDLRLRSDDTLVNFWWRSGATHSRVIRQVSSHRWALGAGGMTVADLATTRLADAQRVIVPSARLEQMLSEVCSVPVLRTPKGYDPTLFYDRGARSGGIVVGWAGQPKRDKGMRMLRQLEPGLRIAAGSVPYAEMPAFYSSLDVLAIASAAEGDPRPLIEAMACGCFVVATDVGIVPELVRDGDNGLIVERTPEAFAEALSWCRRHPSRVREAGRRNAEQMRAARTWTHVAPSWRAALA